MSLAALVLLFLAIGFLTASIKSIAEGGDRHQSPIPSPKEPVLGDPDTKDPSIKDPVNPPVDPNQPTDPSMDYPGLEDEFRWGAESLCKDVQVARDTYKFDVSFSEDNSLVVVQNIEDQGPWPTVDVHGAVIFRKVSPGSPGPSVVVDTVANDDLIDIAVKWDANEQNLVVTVPRGIPWSEEPARPCVSIKITVWVPEDASLDNIIVKTVQLGIFLMDDLSIKLSAHAKLETVVGKVVAASTGSAARDDTIIDIGAPDSFRFNSRFIEVSSVSGYVKGSWPLYDYLGIQTTAGTIKACVEPKEADKNAPKPAILYIRSYSGNVEFREPIHAAQEAFKVSQALAQVQEATDLRAETVLPPRDYRVSVHTTSGNIIGAAAFSSTASFQSTSGKTTVDLLPVLDSSLAQEGSKKVVLTTSSTSGNMYVTVLDPLWVDSQNAAYVALPRAAPVTPPGPDGQPRYVPIGDGDPYSWIPGAAGSRQERSDVALAAALRNLHTDHSSTSAKIFLQFPAVWEGDVNLSAVSGKLKASGEGLRILHQGGHGWPGKDLQARKGPEGGSQTKVSVTSGNVEFYVGKL